ncbi:MAG: IS3 family transposase [Magnetococcus sp. DMHC-1]
MRSWISPETRDEVVVFIRRYAELTEIPVIRLIGWIGIGRDKFYAWCHRHGQVNCHNGAIPRDFWLEEWEKRAIIAFYMIHQEDGYRRLTFMMIDQDVVAVSPASTYRVLKEAGLMRQWDRKKSKKGTGFDQPIIAHQHWHVDISYLNISGTFYYFCGLLDGFSRYIVHWEIRESMTEEDVEIIIQRAKEKYPEARPRIISDNGPQFIAKEFKAFIKLCGMTHVRTSPFYPQSNGKLERFHQSYKRECVRPKTPLSIEDARHETVEYINHYNNERLHGAIGYIAPADKLNGRAQMIFDERKRKLDEARERRKVRHSGQACDGSNESNNMNTLTFCTQTESLPLLGETEVGNAGEQPTKG